MGDFYTKAEQEIIDSFETVYVVLRAYLEKEVNDDNMVEARNINDLLYGLRKMENRILIDYLKNH